MSGLWCGGGSWHVVVMWLLWSLWFVVVTCQMCGGMVTVSKLIWNERQGAHHDRINRNDQ